MAGDHDDGPRITWDHGTAYDLFTSLVVLHDPGSFGIRPSWAAGVRSRLSPQTREALATIVECVSVPVAWIERLEPPRDYARAVDALARVPDTDVYETLVPAEDCDGSRASCIGDARFGASVKAALAEYADRFFREEPPRVEPVVAEGLSRAQELAARLDAVRLVEELSGGLAIEELQSASALTLIPVFWLGPLVLMEMCGDRTVMLFSARPRNVPLIPGAPVPESLILGLRALADPTRLRLVRLLNERSLTQIELARELRLRPPTITHHLRMLRLANVVRLREGVTGEKRYEVRSARFAQLYGDLDEFAGEGVRP